MVWLQKSRLKPTTLQLKIAILTPLNPIIRYHNTFILAKGVDDTIVVETMVNGYARPLLHNQSISTCLTCAGLMPDIAPPPGHWLCTTTSIRRVYQYPPFPLPPPKTIKPVTMCRPLKLLRSSLLVSLLVARTTLQPTLRDTLLRPCSSCKRTSAVMMLRGGVVLRFVGERQRIRRL